MLTHMLVQYLVGLCCLRANPEAVQVELGSLVTDEVLSKKRDVDVTVTIRDDEGSGWAFKAFEVKDEKTPLDVTVIEQLCGKLDDMTSITHRAIVSRSGFSDAAKRKAKHRGVDLYVLEKWETPIDVDFPRFGLRGLPEEAMPFSQWLLVWVDEQVHFIAPAAGRPFNLAAADPVYDSANTIHHRYKSLGDYRHEVLLRSTEELWSIEPAQTMLRTLPKFHTTKQSVTSEWPFAHTLDVSADGVYVKVDDLVKIERITISGSMRWQSDIEQPDFRVMRRVDDGKPFAGALIAPGKREGHMTALVMSDSQTMDIHFVRLEEKHLNMIRELSLDHPAGSGTSES